MDKLIFIGDVHGKMTQFRLLLEKLLTPDALVIQVGDMGLGFPEVYLRPQPENFQWIRGNHDDPKLCRAHKNYLGDYGYSPDLKLFHLAGAWSIDFAWRQAHMKQGGKPVWWADEELSQSELETAVDLYDKSKPEIVVSHECPSEIAQELLSGQNVKILGKDEYFNAKLECQHSRTAQALQTMFRMHQPKHWVFGHYHLDRDIERNGTRFHCCAELSPYELLLETTTAEQPRSTTDGGVGTQQSVNHEAGNL